MSQNNDVFTVTLAWIHVFIICHSVLYMINLPQYTQFNLSPSASSTTLNIVSKIMLDSIHSIHPVRNGSAGMIVGLYWNKIHEYSTIYHG